MTRQRPILDLTVETEQCVLCSRVLGSGTDHLSRIFLFTACGCVRLPRLLAQQMMIAHCDQVICGDCSLGSHPADIRNRHRISLLYHCPRHDHFMYGRQKVREIFGLECAICLTSVSEKYEWPADENELEVQDERVRLPCGDYLPRIRPSSQPLLT